ncbi:probable G-protein coupled receptor 34 isoform X2 [Pleurodeles waltl]|uniref:probable G-protein coupled receptor 34 isoform X2 n=1 Tax=Pleurodeles waltl TaxID=8319 RepID=UPI0037097054
MRNTSFPFWVTAVKEAADKPPQSHSKRFNEMDATVTSIGPFSNLWKDSTTTNTSDAMSNSSPHTSNSTKCTIDEQSLSGVLAVSYSITFIIGIIGNTLALYVFLWIHKERNSIQVYLLNVAIADLLLIFCLPFRIMYHVNQNKWLLGVAFCRIVGNLFYMNMYISIVLLGLISMDRYIKVTRASQRHKMSRTKCSIYICSLLWALSAAAVIPLVAHKLGSKQAESTMCFHYRLRETWKAIFNYFVVVVFWVVFILLILSYVKIAKTLFHVSKARPNLPNSVKYNRTARKSFVVLFIFTICFAPYHAFRFFYITSQLKATSCFWQNIIHNTNEIMLVFSAFNSCLDPVMYFTLSSSVRKTVFQLLCRDHRDTSRSESVTSECPHGQSQAPVRAVSSSGTVAQTIHFARIDS